MAYEIVTKKIVAEMSAILNIFNVLPAKYSAT